MISDDLRRHIKESGISAFKLGGRIGTNSHAIRKFLAVDGGLSQDISDRIGKELGLVLCKQGEPVLRREPPNWEEELLETAFEMMTRFLEDRYFSNKGAIIDAMRAKRRHNAKV